MKFTHLVLCLLALVAMLDFAPSAQAGGVIGVSAFSAGCGVPVQSFAVVQPRVFAVAAAPVFVQPRVSAVAVSGGFGGASAVAVAGGGGFRGRSVAVSRVRTGLFGTVAVSRVRTR